jgi:PAS domain S-box-containing protein
MTHVTPDLICRLDARGVIVSAAGGNRSFPFSASALVGRSLAAVVPPSGASSVQQALATAADGGDAVAIHLGAAEGGAERHVELRVTADGPSAYWAVFRDVGPERRELAERTSQREFLRQVLDLDPSLIFAKDRAGRFTLANRAVAAIYGVTPQRLVGRTDADFNPDGTQVERFLSDDLEVMNSLRPMRIAKEPVTSPDGATRWFQTIKIPIVSADGRANAVLGVSSDITLRKEAEDHLERRGEQLLRHHHALRELALATDSDFRTALTRILRTAARALGVERTGLWLLDGDRTALRADWIFDHGAISDEPSRIFLANDHPEYFRALNVDRIVAAADARIDPRTTAFTAPYLDALGITSMLDVAILSNGAMIGAVCHEQRGVPRIWTIEEQDFAASVADLVALALEESKRASLEEQLRNAQKMEAIGLLAGGIAHDFNNLLNIIMGYAGLAAQSLPAEHAAASHLDKITTACKRSADLVKKILTFSRGQVLHVEPIEFGTVVREFSTLLMRILGDDIELSVTTSDEPMIVDADRTQLEQILLNLCTNARQAMPQGGTLTLDARPVRLEDEAPGPYVHLRVGDTGHGIDDATMSRLWEPFFTTKSEGTGLGLSMVYGIVRQHGGLIRAESRVGRGSTFHVFFPLRPAPVARQFAPAPARDARGYETILVAEDESLIRDLLKERFGELGYTVLLAENGAEAVELFARNQAGIDLVILDVVMPKLGGPDVLARIESMKPGIKALFVSGHAPESVRLPEHLQTRGRAFLAKPFSFDALSLMVRKLLDGDA